MKKLVGGDYLLDLTPIEIEQSEDGATNITNADVIAQLTNLKRYVKNPSMIKPVWVRFVNGENDELVVARGTFANVDSGEFEICVAINGYKLRIFIEFTQATLSDNTPIDDWYIATNDAKYLFTSDAQNIGAISELPVFENIVDAQGHKRFIEGDITIETIAGVTQTFGKWSLSGTHLMIVVALEIVENVSLTNGQLIANVNLPDWVKAKIIPLYSDYVSYVSTKNIGAGSDTSFDFSLRNYENVVSIKSTAITTTRDENVRIQFDLLID